MTIENTGGYWMAAYSHNGVRCIAEGGSFKEAFMACLELIANRVRG